MVMRMFCLTQSWSTNTLLNPAHRTHILLQKPLADIQHHRVPVMDVKALIKVLKWGDKLIEAECEPVGAGLNLRIGDRGSRG